MSYGTIDLCQVSWICLDGPLWAVAAMRHTVVLFIGVIRRHSLPQQSSTHCLSTSFTICKSRKTFTCMCDTCLHRDLFWILQVFPKVVEEFVCRKTGCRRDQWSSQAALRSCSAPSQVKANISLMIYTLQWNTLKIMSNLPQWQWWHFNKQELWAREGNCY